ncbi:hypothetical protein G6F63_016967 [Rhizopus arrhizus]|nr:hypothetical protein G6F63_016967 [Rhizopus arrhizus]
MLSSSAAAVKLRSRAAASKTRKAFNGGRLCPAMSADARPRAGQAQDCAALSHDFPCCGLIGGAALTGRLPCSAAF